MFNSITTDGSNIIYAHEIFKIESTGNSTIATKAQLDNAIITAGGLSQQDLDDAVAPLIIKDTAFAVLSTKPWLLSTGPSNDSNVLKYSE